MERRVRAAALAVRGHRLYERRPRSSNPVAVGRSVPAEFAVQRELQNKVGNRGLEGSPELQLELIDTRHPRS